ncbi:hypothetical protein GOBAR_DD19600 [Gossypium barbadense]|nr:hypothetical protein GOBAR_DD19600 [Gossypium barbadense]
MEDLILKKVQFMDNDKSVNREVLVDLTNVLVISWKDKLVGISSNNEEKGLQEEEEFENRGLIGKVAELDMNTDNKIRGRLVRMVVFSKPNSGRTMPSSKYLTEAVSMVVDETGEKIDGYRFMALTEKEGNVVIKFGKNEKIQDTQQRMGKEIAIKGNQGAGANNGLVSFSNLVIDPRTTFNGSFKGLRESSLLKDSTSGQGNGSNSGPGENKIMVVPDQVMEVFGKLIRNLVASRNQGRIADGGNDGSDSHSHIAGDGNKLENME